MLQSDDLSGAEAVAQLALIEAHVEPLKVRCSMPDPKIGAGWLSSMQAPDQSEIERRR